jgi:hypothetical protein
MAQNFGIRSFYDTPVGSKIKMPTINFKKFVANDSIGEIRTNGQQAPGRPSPAFVRMI